MSLADAVAEFETGSGLTVSQLGTGFAWFGGIAVCLIVAWAILQFVRGIATDRLPMSVAYGKSFYAVIVLAACIAFFATGSPLAP